MSLLKRVCALVLIVGSTLVGCNQGDLDSEDLGTAQQADKFGGGSTNGLGAELYFQYEESLFKAADYQLVAPGRIEDVNPVVAEYFLEGHGGDEVFEYAMKCALPRNTTVVMEGKPYLGLGLIQDGADWLEGPLSATARYELMACMAAHLNPGEEGVPLLLSGPFTEDDGQDHTSFTVDEALWTVRQNVDGTLIYLIWTFDQWPLVCSPDPAAAIVHRVCGLNPSGCNLEAHDAQNCVRNKKTDTYTCLGQPALRTTLREADAIYMDSYCL